MLTTGRAGSTTILDMLNSIPMISIAGELQATKDGLKGKGLIPTLVRALDISRAVTGKEGGARYAKPDVTGLKKLVCGWLRLMMPVHKYAGFKDLYTHLDGTLPHLFATLGKPLRVVRSFRYDLAAQAKSAEKAKLKRTVNTSWWDQNTQALMRATEQAPHFDMPLESFSVARFNALLRFLNINNCSFTSVLHANANGGYGVAKVGAPGLVRGNCVYVRPAV